MLFLSPSFLKRSRFRWSNRRRGNINIKSIQITRCLLTESDSQLCVVCHCLNLSACLLVRLLSPNSSLGAIVIVALLPMFRRLAELNLLGYLNKWDVAVWMVTWCSVLFFDVIFGAGIGMAFNLIVRTLQHQMARKHIYISRNRYKALIIPPNFSGLAITSDRV